MRTHIRTLAVAAVLLLASGGVFAHDNFRVIGTVAAYDAPLLQVKDRSGKATVVRLDKQTAITRDKKKVEAAELKVGRSVVVDAWGDDESDLLALEIRIVPPIAAR